MAYISDNAAPELGQWDWLEKIGGAIATAGEKAVQTVITKYSQPVAPKAQQTASPIARTPAPVSMTVTPAVKTGIGVGAIALIAGAGLLVFMLARRK